MGLNLTVGYAGQMSLGQAAFFGIGAYIAAIALKAGVPFFVVLPIAALACFAVGLALGFPALRVQHHYLAFATLGFNVLVFLVMRNEEKITGGTFGISGIPRPSLFGYSLDGTLAVLLLHAGRRCSCWRRCCGGCCARRGDARSRRCATTRSAPRASASTSPPTRCSRSRSARRARASPACSSRRWSQFIEPAPFHFSTSLMMLLAVIVGGSGTFFGPVLGTVIIVLLPEWLRVHAELVPRGLRLRGRRADDLAAGRLLSIPERFAKRRRERRRMTRRSSKSRTCSKQYGAIKAVDGVSFDVGPGEIVGVIGPNGSGKTTLFNSILGQIKPTSGHVEFCGEDITGMSPLELSRRGVGRTFQTLQVFGQLSVRDNLIVAAQEFKGTLRGRLFAPPDAGLGAARRRDDRAVPAAARRAPAGRQRCPTASRS